jgi:hypothetical protein
MPVSIVLEHHATVRPWHESGWRLIDVVPNSDEHANWEETARGEGWVRYAARVLALKISAREAGCYQQNLASAKPQVFVILHRNADNYRMDPFFVTVCPSAAHAYIGSRDGTVRGFEMSQPIRQWLVAFVDAHPLSEKTAQRRQMPWLSRSAGVKIKSR